MVGATGDSVLLGCDTELLGEWCPVTGRHITEEPSPENGLQRCRSFFANEVSPAVL